MGVSSPVDQINLVNTISQRLRQYTTEDEVEAFFSTIAHITDPLEKTALLHNAMHMTVYGVADEDAKPDPQDVYRYYLNIYVQGEWKAFIND
jgi:hypothetical protein